MQYLWELTIDDFIEICEIAKKNGKKPGENMEEEFLQYMKEKGKTPSCATELTKEELSREYNSKGKSILDGTIDNKGDLSFVIKKAEK